MRPAARRLTAGVILSALLGAVGGCGGGDGNDVAGTVTLDGQPLAGAEVQLVPKADPTLGGHTSATDAGGRFAFREPAGSNTPIKPGMYAVLVSKLSGKGGGMGDLANEVPAVYRDRAKTPLSAEVQAGRNTLPPFELKSNKK